MKITIHPVPDLWASFDEVGLLCKRYPNKPIVVNVPRVVTSHSPGGFEWGYAGSGPSDFALNALIALLPKSIEDDPNIVFTTMGYKHKVRVNMDAAANYQEFKHSIIARIPREGGWVKLADLDEWLAARGLRRAWNIA